MPGSAPQGEPLLHVLSLQVIAPSSHQIWFWVN